MYLLCFAICLKKHNTWTTWDKAIGQELQSEKHHLPRRHDVRSTQVDLSNSWRLHFPCSMISAYHCSVTIQLVKSPCLTLFYHTCFITKKRLNQWLTTIRQKFPMNSMIWLTICCRSVTKLSGCCRYRPIQRSSILEKINYDFVSIICIISVYIYIRKL